MKKLTIYMFMLVGLVAFSACGGIESDAKAFAEKSCACEKLVKENKEEDSKKCMDEQLKQGEELVKKYKDNKDEQGKFDKAYLEAYKACSK